MVVCNNACVDPQTNESNCGADSNCIGGTVCGEGQICDGGMCVLNCQPGLTECGGLCVDTDTDEDYCGLCTNSCASDEMCIAGSCEICLSDNYAPVPKTGQTTSYYSGDDGDLQMGFPKERFTDNGDGTVTDNYTGLMWTKNAQQISGTKTWSAALSSCNGLDYAGYDDWRLPNVRELLSLLDYGATHPAVPSDNPFNNIQVAWYWSSTTDEYNRIRAWSINIDCGHVSDYGKDVFNYVWPVRDGQVLLAQTPVPRTGQTKCYDSSGSEINCIGSGQDGEYQRGLASPNPRFIDNDDGTITDNLTKLIWLKNANCIETDYPSFDNDNTAGDGGVTWQHAFNFITGINNGTYSSCNAGHNDWRLPNIRELHSLIDYGEYNPSLSLGHLFDNVETAPYDAYWSSTTNECSIFVPEVKWFVRMYCGHIHDFPETMGTFYVWPVRGGQ